MHVFEKLPPTDGLSRRIQHYYIGSVLSENGDSGKDNFSQISQKMFGLHGKCG